MFNKDQKQMIRNAVKLAILYWPNSHLGDQTKSEDIITAFQFIRANIKNLGSLEQACTALEINAYTYQDM